MGAGSQNNFIFTGDLNTEPDSSTIRFLKGKKTFEGNSSFFVDAFDFNDNGMNDFATSEFNDWVQELNHTQEDIIMDAIFPKRRIDYILSHGWVYGRKGCPINYYRFGKKRIQDGFSKDLSDHWGIISDILI